MLLSAILDQLAKGELSTLANEYDEHTSGALDYGSHESVIPHINLGLTALHTRFPLRKGKVIVQQFEAVSTYYLELDYAASTNSNVTDPTHYIADTNVSPFLSNILRIEKVIDELGELLPLNDPSEDTSLWMPQFNALEVPFPSDNVTMTVHFRANHPEVTNDDFDPETTKVLLPQAYLNCLLLFVAARVHASVPSLEGTNNGAMYEAKYERACMEIEHKGMVHKDESPQTKFSSRGFV